MSRSFLDTNILLYSISADPREKDKRSIAIEILDGDHCALSVQVLQEFFVRATQPRKADPIPAALARALIERWRRFPVQETSLSLFDAALEIHLRYRFSYWDSAIVAAAVALGCDTLFSEDMSHGQIVEGVRIVDPFRS